MSHVRRLTRSLNLRTGIPGLIVGAIGCLGLVASGSSVAGAADQAGYTSEAALFASVPAPPSPSASAATWQQWAAMQREAMESATWAGIEAAQGSQLTRLTLLAGPTPGTPAGITVTTIAVGMVVTPTAVASNRAVPSTPDNITHCTPVKHGTGCINALTETSGTVIQATYEYQQTGAMTGRLDLGEGGCPGTFIRQFSGLTLYHDETAKITYGPILADNEWSSTFFHGADTDFGSVCREY